MLNRRTATAEGALRIAACTRSCDRFSGRRVEPRSITRTAPSSKHWPLAGKDTFWRELAVTSCSMRPSEFTSSAGSGSGSAAAVGGAAAALDSSAGFSSPAAVAGFSLVVAAGAVFGGITRRAYSTCSTSKVTELTSGLTVWKCGCVATIKSLLTTKQLLSHMYSHS